MIFDIQYYCMKNVLNLKRTGENQHPDTHNNNYLLSQQLFLASWFLDYLVNIITGKCKAVSKMVIGSSQVQVYSYANKILKTMES